MFVKSNLRNYWSYLKIISSMEIQATPSLCNIGIFNGPKPADRPAPGTKFRASAARYFVV